MSHSSAPYALPVLIDDEVLLMLAGSVATSYANLDRYDQQTCLLRELGYIVAIHPYPATFTEKLTVFLYESHSVLSSDLQWPRDISPIIQWLKRSALDLKQTELSSVHNEDKSSHYQVRENFLKVLFPHAPNLPSEPVLNLLAGFINSANNPVTEAMLITGYFYNYLPRLALLDDTNNDDEEIDQQHAYVVWFVERLMQKLNKS